MTRTSPDQSPNIADQRMRDQVSKSSNPEDAHWRASPGSNSFVSLKDGKVIRYDHFVSRLFKKETFRHMADHARGGICEEAGELSSAIKKHVVYGKDPDIKNIIEELGDLRFFMQAAMELYGITEQQILQHNACKLEERYEMLEFTEEAARARRDKKIDEQGKEES